MQSPRVLPSKYLMSEKINTKNLRIENLILSENSFFIFFFFNTSKHVLFVAKMQFGTWIKASPSSVV